MSQIGSEALLERMVKKIFELEKRIEALSKELERFKNYEY